MKGWISRRIRADSADGRPMTAMIGGLVLGVGVLASGAADAYWAKTVRVTEGERAVISYALPAFPHEARRYSQGYEGVRYSICFKDGTATSFRFTGFDSMERNPEADYLSLCGIALPFESPGRFAKRIGIHVPTFDDSRQEGDEDFTVELTNPEVKRPGRDWASHGGSHHIPSRISFRVIIEDND